MVQLNEIGVTASPVALNTRTGDQVFKESDYQGAPTQTTSQILQQSIAGAARAPTGEVHIDGQHAEYTYYIDGLPVPPGISGSLNELFDPAVVNTINFQTGGWDAEVRPAQRRDHQRPDQGALWPVPHVAHRLRRQLRQQRPDGDDERQLGQVRLLRRRDAAGHRSAPRAGGGGYGCDRKDHGVRNYANDGQDLFGFAKAQYVATDHDLINLDMNFSRSRFATPFDSAAGVINDRQQDINHFINLSWQHRDVAVRTPAPKRSRGSTTGMAHSTTRRGQ